MSKIKILFLTVVAAILQNRMLDGFGFASLGISSHLLTKALNTSIENSYDGENCLEFFF